jgi:hypothetical protein
VHKKFSRSAVFEIGTPDATSIDNEIESTVESISGYADVLPEAGKDAPQIFCGVFC